jgi:hypothetical protein
VLINRSVRGTDIVPSYDFDIFDFGIVQTVWNVVVVHFITRTLTHVIIQTNTQYTWTIWVNTQQQQCTIINQDKRTQRLDNPRCNILCFIYCFLIILFDHPIKGTSASHLYISNLLTLIECDTVNPETDLG